MKKRKSELIKVQNIIENNRVKTEESFFELMEGVYQELLGYIVEMIARNALPGIGDGGGLSASGLREVSDRVKRDFEKLKLTGRIGRW